MSRWEPYPRYEDSGVQGIGEIPVHWQHTVFQRVISSMCDGPFGSNMKSSHYADDGVRLIRLQNIGLGRFEDSDKAYIPAAHFASLPGHEARPGDLLIAGLGDRNHPVGRACLVPDYISEAMVKADCFRLRLEQCELSHQFAMHYLCSAAARAVVGSRSRGSTRSRINRQGVTEIDVVVPPLSEQRHIADFLDRKTTQIDELIAKKQQLIELLQEKRTALISHAVTKGLDPNVPMKGSGVEWLGEIPTHWYCLPLARRWEVIDCKHRTVPFVDDGVPLASIGEVKGIDLDLATAKMTTRDEYLQMIEGGRKPHKGDIIYSRNATVGAAAYVNTSEDFCMGQDVCLIRSHMQNQRFLVHQLRSPLAATQLKGLMVGATFKRINVAQIKRLLVCCPPPTEQGLIAEYLDSVCTATGSVVGKVRGAISRLQEYRTALISAAVTGKIDVREEM